MTTTAKDAQLGKLYRQTRNAGTTYFRLCEPSTISKLERRLAGKSVLTMRPDDRALRRALERCRKERHLLFLRVMRLRRDDGRGYEMRTYVAVPPAYALREVERPPGYGLRTASKESRP